MPDIPYCPLLSINKDTPVMCQEELCMWYVKQLKLCSITVLAYTNALNMQAPPSPTNPMPPGQKPQESMPNLQKQQAKPNLTSKPKKEENPFVLDDLD